MPNAAVALVGAGDYIGAAIAGRFAAEGYRVYGGRRNGDQLAPLKAQIEAAGGRFEARTLDARNEEQVTAFMAEADTDQPLVAICKALLGAEISIHYAYPLLIGPQGSDARLLAEELDLFEVDVADAEEAGPAAG